MQMKGWAVIFHKISCDQLEMFARDGVHLSIKGNDLFLEEIQNGLKKMM